MIETNEISDTVNYLINAAGLLPVTNHAQRLIKSYYLVKSRKLSKFNGQQQHSFFSDEEVCHKCATPWVDTNYSMSIKPMQLTKRQAYKIRQRINDKSVDSRKQKFAKKSVKKANNVMIVECDLCKNQNRVVLWKRKQYAEQVQQTNEANVVDEQVEEIQTVPLLKKKKKRKKDKTAGLSVTISKNEQNSAPVVKQSIITPKVATNPQTTNTLKKPKANAPSKKPKIKFESKPVPTALQKKSNLLQLANALKMKSKQPSNDSTTNKLKHLLN